MWEELGISGGTGLILLLILFFVIKNAVKNGIKQAFRDITGKETYEDKHWKEIWKALCHSSSGGFEENMGRQRCNDDYSLYCRLRFHDHHRTGCMVCLPGIYSYRRACGSLCGIDQP